jgi:hypothetical protein
VTPTDQVPGRNGDPYEATGIPFELLKAWRAVPSPRTESRPPGPRPELAIRPIALARPSGRYCPELAVRPIVFACRPADTEPMKRTHGNSGSHGPSGS